MVQTSDKASTPLQPFTFLAATVLIISAIGSIALGTGGLVSNNAVESSDTTQDVSTTASRDVEIVFERAGNNISVAANGGDDLANVTEFTITNASVNGTMDPDSDYPQVTGTIDPPTTVKVEATFEDGTTQIVAEKEFS